MDQLLTEATNLIKLHEGFKNKAYLDTKGNITIGYGRNLKGNPPTLVEWNTILFPNGITQNQAEQLLEPQIIAVNNWLSASFSWWNNLTINRKLCLIDIVFNIGEDDFLQFHDTIAALANGNYTAAAADLKNSEWYRDVGQRARNDVLLMING